MENRVSHSGIMAVLFWWGLSESKSETICRYHLTKCIPHLNQISLIFS